MQTQDTKTARFEGHIPGPYYLDRIDNEGCCDLSFYAKSESGNPVWVGRVYGQGYTVRDPELIAQRNATGYLIAAAPTLLAERDRLAAQVAQLRDALERSYRRMAQLKDTHIQGTPESEDFAIVIAVLAATAPKP